MKKVIVSFFLASLVMGFRVETARASLLTVEPDGDLLFNVLSAESDPGNFQVEEVANEKADNSSIIKLNQSEGKFNLEVYGNSGIKNLNITNYKDAVVEIQQRPDVQKMEIGIQGDKFSINNNGIIAVTRLPITVDSKNAEVNFMTDSGEMSLKVLPTEARKTALRSKFMSQINESGIEIISERETLQYKIDGKKIFNLLNIYDYSISVSSYISAVDGEVVKIDAPSWFKFVNFLLT